MVYFSMYEYLKKISNDALVNSTSSLKFLVPLVASSVSEVMAILTYLPFDIVRTRLQVNLPNYQYIGIVHGLRDV